MADTPTTAVTQRHREQFDTFLRAMQGGRFNQECTEKLDETVRACSAHAERTNGKAKAKLTITIDVMLDRGVFDIGSQVNAKFPVPLSGRTIAFATETGGLSLSNPQLDMALPARDAAVEAERFSPRDAAAGDERTMRVAR